MSSHATHKQNASTGSNCCSSSSTGSRPGDPAAVPAAEWLAAVEGDAVTATSTFIATKATTQASLPSLPSNENDGFNPELGVTIAGPGGVDSSVKVERTGASTTRGMRKGSRPNGGNYVAVHGHDGEEFTHDGVVLGLSKTSVGTAPPKSLSEATESVGEDENARERASKFSVESDPLRAGTNPAEHPAGFER